MGFPKGKQLLVQRRVAGTGMRVAFRPIGSGFDGNIASAFRRAIPKAVRSGFTVGRKQLLPLLSKILGPLIPSIVDAVADQIGLSDRDAKILSKALRVGIEKGGPAIAGLGTHQGGRQMSGGRQRSGGVLGMRQAQDSFSINKPVSLSEAGGLFPLGVSSGSGAGLKAEIAKKAQKLLNKKSKSVLRNLLKGRPVSGSGLIQI